ncbi:MAG: acyl carrier protein [Rhizobiaceae bacterium]|nr:acyl carrier protein [Rhizobiaceae bacterium]
MGLEHFELAMAIEEEFGVEVSDEDVEKFITVQDVVDFVLSKKQQSQKPNLDEAAIVSRTLYWVTELVCMKAQELKPTDRLIEDLGYG